MKFTRRHFIQSTASCLALTTIGLPSFDGAVAQPAPTAVSPRMRLEDFVKDPARVASLRRGVAVMKSRKPSDPLSWFFQASVHGVADAQVDQAIKQDPDVAKVDQKKFWRQCPHYPELGLASVNFIIWHRAYLYYFERILRDAAGDPKLSLPYWNYTEKTQRSFPQILATPVDEQRQPNPLYEPKREGVFVRGLYDLSDRAVSLERAMRAAEFFGTVGENVFAGAIDDLEPRSQGLIERSPHNLIHLAVGGQIPQDDGPDAMGLMSNVATAAFDPVFWLHHANIDRLWSVWDAMPTKKWGDVPTSAWFEEKTWWFYDVDGTVKNEARGFYIQNGNLKLSFDTDKPGAKRLSDKLPAGGTPVLMLAVAKAAHSEVHDRGHGVAAAPGITVGRTSVPLRLNAAAEVTQSVPLSMDVSAATAKSAFRSAVPESPRRVLLQLSGVDFDVTPSVGYDIFINLPAGEKPDPASPSHAGILSLFGIKHGANGASHGSQAFDITRIVQQRKLDPTTLKVTLVPFDLLIPKPGNAPLHRDATVTISEIKVLVVEGKLQVQ